MNLCTPRSDRYLPGDCSDRINHRSPSILQLCGVVRFIVACLGSVSVLLWEDCYLENWPSVAHIGVCPNPVTDPVNAVRFMTAANTLQRRARSAALNAPFAAQLLRTGTRRGFLDIDLLPVRLGMPND